MIHFKKSNSGNSISLINDITNTTIKEEIGGFLLDINTISETIGITIKATNKFYGTYNYNEVVINDIIINDTNIEELTDTLFI